MCGLDGVASDRPHDISDVKAAYPEIRTLMTRKKDSCRNVGLTRRKFSMAQKHRTNKRLLREEKIDGAEEKIGRKGKKLRKEYQTRWASQADRIMDPLAKISDRTKDRRDRFRLPGAGNKLQIPIINNQNLLQNITFEMSETFEHLGYEDIARNFTIELEFLDLPFDWVFDADDDNRDLILRTKRVQYYLTKHLGPEKTC